MEAIVNGGFESNDRLVLAVYTYVPVGVNVTIHLTGGLGLTFSNVTAEGYAWTDTMSMVEAPTLPALAGQYHVTRVTASYSGNVTVSLAYDDSNMTEYQESNLLMMQYTPILGDIVNYGEVNILDVNLIATCWGKTSASPGWNAAADITRDGNVNILDMAKCAKNFWKTARWTDITTYVDTGLNIIWGETKDFLIIGIQTLLVI